MTALSTNSTVGTGRIVLESAAGGGGTAGTVINTQAPAQIGRLLSYTDLTGTNATPWIDPANGDFRINLAAAKGTGRGNFTETQASYTGTVAYPDIGAGQGTSLQSAKSSTYGP